METEGEALSLADRVERVRRTLETESAGWGKVPKLIAVTKYAAAEQILPLRKLGVSDIGENRVQVLLEKKPFLGENFAIHLIGRLQTNKVKYIIKDVCMIHSVDRPELALEIDRQAQKAGLVMPVLLQVNIAHETQKGGVDPQELMPLLRSCAALPGLKVSGLMAIMPADADDETLTGLFGGMRRLFEQCRDENVQNTAITELSMGMTRDYALAARAGATMVRVGSALFK